MLLHAQDAEGGGGMTDRQLRDEVITLFLAGHETTANALTWTWVLLARHPEVEAHLHAELDAVLDGRVPTADDVARLPYTRAVVAESMRLYPPAWTHGPPRAARLPLGRARHSRRRPSILMSQWIVQRDPRWWPEPDALRSRAMARRGAGTRPRFAYFPFGGGNRVCIGESFAWSEAIAGAGGASRSAGGSCSIPRTRSSRSRSSRCARGTACGPRRGRRLTSAYRPRKRLPTAEARDGYAPGTDSTRAANPGARASFRSHVTSTAPCDLCHVSR